LPFDLTGRISLSMKATTQIGRSLRAEGVTNADRILPDAVHRFEPQGDPAVRHLIAAERNEKS
jgi:hypothetical protein